MKSKLKEISNDFFISKPNTHRHIQSKSKIILLNRKSNIISMPWHLYINIHILRSAYKQNIDYNLLPLEKSVYNINMLSCIKFDFIKLFVISEKYIEQRFNDSEVFIVLGLQIMSILTIYILIRM